jgi:hypothetical protein
MFMDTSGMSEKQKRYVELCRDELLKKKELALDSMRGSMGPLGALMGDYMPPYGGGGFMVGGGGGFVGGGVGGSMGGGVGAFMGGVTNMGGGLGGMGGMEGVASFGGGVGGMGGMEGVASFGGGVGGMGGIEATNGGVGGMEDGNEHNNTGLRTVQTMETNNNMSNNDA